MLYGQKYRISINVTEREGERVAVLKIHLCAIACECYFYITTTTIIVFFNICEETRIVITHECLCISFMLTTATQIFRFFFSLSGKQTNTRLSYVVVGTMSCGFGW